MERGRSVGVGAAAGRVLMSCLWRTLAVGAAALRRKLDAALLEDRASELADEAIGRLRRPSAGQDELAALGQEAMVELLDPPESAAIDPPPVSAPLQARRKGTDYWLAGDFEAAAAQFLKMAQLYSEGTAARSQA